MEENVPPYLNEEKSQQAFHVGGFLLKNFIKKSVKRKCVCACGVCVRVLCALCVCMCACMRVCMCS